MPNLIRDEIRLYGLRVALRRFVRRRHLQAAAYIMVAIFAIGGFAQERAYNNRHQRDLAIAVYRSSVATCQSGNSVRGVIRTILKGEVAQTALLARTHKIPADRAKSSEDLITGYLSLVKNRNCTGVSTDLLKK